MTGNKCRDEAANEAGVGASDRQAAGGDQSRQTKRRTAAEEIGRHDILAASGRQKRRSCAGSAKASRAESG